MCRVLLLVLVVPLSLAFAPKPMPKTDKGKDEKRFVVAVNGKGWREVFKWLAEASGKPVITPLALSGTCTVIAPSGKRYTFNEVIDILNDDLSSKKRTVPLQCLLVPSARSIALVFWESVPGTRWERVAIKDLPRFPRTVPVSIVLVPKTLIAGDLVPQVEKMLGPFGEVIARKGTNQLMMIDQVRYLAPIVKVIQKLDGAKKP